MTAEAATPTALRASLDPVRILTWAVLLGGVALAAFGAVDTPGFLTGTNVRSVLAQSAFVGVFALGTTVIMISGSLFSLSLAVTGAITASSFLALLPHGQVPAILVTLALGIAICLIQGFLVGAFGANPIIVTIAAGGLQEGIFLWWSGGATIVPSFSDTSYQWLNRLIHVPWVGPLPLAVFILVGLVLVVEFVLRFTRFGRLLFFVGENRRAAVAAGIPTAWIITGAFAIAGFCTALAGIELGAFNQSGSLLVESNFTYDGIAAAVVGGTAISGGRGSAFRALGGAILMAGIADLVLLRGYSEGWQILIQGLVVLAVVVLARLNRMRSGQMASSLSARIQTLRPYLTFAIVALVFVLLPTFKSGAHVATVNWKNIMQDLSSLGLVTLALGLTMVAGEFDLSVSSSFLLGSMLAVKTGVHSPIEGVLIAVACGLGIGFVQGAIIAKLRMNSMTVTLGGFIAMLGLVFVISDSQSISYPDLAVGARLDKSIVGVFSIRIFVTLALFVVIAAVFLFTTIGRDLRSAGSDRKASRTAGVRVDWLVIGVFTLSGFLASLGGALQGYSLAYATPDRTVAPLIFATTAALLGGVALSGGRGDPLGIAAGVLTLGVITEAIPVLHSPEYVNSLIPALVLLIVILFDAPGLKRRLTLMRARSSQGGPPGPLPGLAVATATAGSASTVSDNPSERGNP